MSEEQAQAQEQVVEESTVNEPRVEEKADEQENKRLAGSSFYKQKLAEIEAEKQRLAQELEQERTQKLQEKENFKELWELEKQKRAEAEEKSKTIATNYFNGLKNSAIKQEALKAGILDTAIEDLDIIDNSMVEIETTDRGNASVLGAKEFVEALKEKKPHWFKKVGAPNINNANPMEAKHKELTPADLIRLQKEDPAKYKAEMRKRLGVA